MEEKQFEMAITEAVTNTAKSVEMLSDAFMRHQETLQTLIEHVKQLQSRVDKLEEATGEASS